MSLYGPRKTIFTENVLGQKLHMNDFFQCESLYGKTFFTENVLIQKLHLNGFLKCEALYGMTKIVFE